MKSMVLGTSASSLFEDASFLRDAEMRLFAFSIHILISYLCVLGGVVGDQADPPEPGLLARGIEAPVLGLRPHGLLQRPHTQRLGPLTVPIGLHRQLPISNAPTPRPPPLAASQQGQSREGQPREGHWALPSAEELTREACVRRPKPLLSPRPPMKRRKTGREWSFADFAFGEATDRPRDLHREHALVPRRLQQGARHEPAHAAALPRAVRVSGAAVLQEENGGGEHAPGMLLRYGREAAHL